jgi:hypothetical protein
MSLQIAATILIVGVLFGVPAGWGGYIVGDWRARRELADRIGELGLEVNLLTIRVAAELRRRHSRAPRRAA